jgi:hypothetical protein
MKGLEIGLQARAPAGIRTGNRERNARGHPLSLLKNQMLGFNSR